jgi:hypothetical protein
MEDGTKFLETSVRSFEQRRREVYHLSEILRQVGDVEISRRLITLCLETRIERLLVTQVSMGHELDARNLNQAYLSESNLVSQTMEAADAHLRVADIIELGESKTVTRLDEEGEKADKIMNLPFASTGGGINDGLGSLNLAESRSELEE